MITAIISLIVVIIAFKIAGGVLRNIWFKITIPFRYMHMAFTGTLPGSDNGCKYEGGVHYKNALNLIVFGIFGNILYWGIIIGGISLLLFGRPHGDTYAVHAQEYTVGQEVYFKNKELCTIKKVGTDKLLETPVYTLETEDGKTKNGIRSWQIYEIRDRSKDKKNISGLNFISDRWLFDSVKTDIQFIYSQFKWLFTYLKE